MVDFNMACASLGFLCEKSRKSSGSIMGGSFFSAHLIGYVGEINKPELNRLRDYGYKLRDTIGKDGVEQSYDMYLQGQRGGKQIEISASGRPLKLLSKKDAVKGNDIVLTIDKNMQKIVEEIFEHEAGSVIIMDPFSGEIAGYTIQPGSEALPPSQAAQTAIGLQEDLLGHILGILEVAKFGIHVGIDAGFILVHKYAESFWPFVEAFVNYISIFRSHFLAPVYPLIVMFPRTTEVCQWM